MPKDNESIPQFDPGPIAPSERPGFTPDQMVSCEKCGRSNPPTRSNCLYCGAAFSLDEQTVALRSPALRPLQLGELGYSIVFVPSPSLPPQSITEIASLLKLTNDEVSSITNATVSLPLARTSDSEEARLIQTRLAGLGLGSVIVADADLKVEENPPLRVRAAELSETGLLLQQVTTDRRWNLAWASLTLLVPARLTIKSFASRERKASRTENELVDSSETQTDEAVVDVYAEGCESSFRIGANSFDFSCLGQRKTLLANDNFKLLMEVILDHAPSAVFDDSYRFARQTLDLVWPSEKRTESQGWRREGLGKVTFGTVTEVSNERQFSRYSRLRHYLRQHPEQHEA